MSAISLKSITGITSITTPAGVDNQLTLHTNDTTQRVKVTESGVEIAGVTTTSGDLFVDGNVDSVGIITARSTIDAQGSINLADSIIHTGDTDTKIAFTNNQIDLQCAGSSRAYINNYALYISSGFPLAFLASSGATPNIKSGGTNAQDLLFTTGTGNPTRMQIKSDGNIGIGTDTVNTTQDRALTVYGTTGGELQLRAANFGGGGSGEGANLTYSYGSLFLTNNATNGDIHFLTKKSGESTTEKMRVTESGYVGINSTSPNAYLDIGAHNTGNPTLRVKNHTAAGAFANNYGSEFRHVFNSMNHAMLIHTQEAADARRTLDISDANGIFATFTNGKVGLGGLTTPSAKLHALDNSSTTTTILKLRNHRTGVNTKPRMAFEAVTSANQGANSFIQGLAGSDAAGNNSYNESGLEFIVTYGGSGTERSAMKLDHDGVCTVPRQPKFSIRCNTSSTFGVGGNFNTSYRSPIPTFTNSNRTELTMRAFSVTYPSYAGGNYPKIVVPVDGFYMFGFAGNYFVQNSADFIGFGFDVNNEGNYSSGYPPYLICSAHSNNNYYDIVHNISGNIGIQLSAGDYVVFYQWSSTSGRFDENVHLYGYLVG